MYRDKDKIDLDQNVTNRNRILDSVFLHFEKDWKKFVSRDQVLTKAVLTEQPEAWEPLIFSDCAFYAEAGTNVPHVEISWNAKPTQNPIRFDIALHYKGFEKNYYTTVLPAEKETRFNIPPNSTFLKDSAAVLLTGPALFPKVLDFHQQVVQSQDTASNPSLKKQIILTKQVLHLTELGSGLSYRIRMCTYVNEVWRPTQEVIFTTPICPMDMK